MPNDQKDIFSEDHPPKNLWPMKITAFFIVLLAVGFGFYFAVKTLIVDRVNNGVTNINGLSGDDLLNGPFNNLFLTGDSNELTKFASYEELRQFIEAHPTSSDALYNKGVMMDAIPLVETELSSADRGAVGLGAPPTQYSTTNVQVEGVDEADIIKTDGEYIYAVSKQNLFIIDARPAEEATILTTITFDSTPRDIYINGDFLVMYGDDETIQSKVSSDIRRSSPYTFVKIFNIADKKNPVQVRDLDFEGYYTTSRMIGDYVYFVTNHSQSYLYDDEQPVPIILENGAIRAGESDVYYFDIDYDDYNFTTITAINMKDVADDLSSQVYLLDINQTLYVSQSNMYIAYTKRLSDYELQVQAQQELLFDRLTPEKQLQIQEIQAAKPFILSDIEKTEKISRIFEQYLASLTDEEQNNVEKEIESALKDKYKELVDQIEKTVIHKIGINGKNLEAKDVGEVPGYVLNQFSMDEHEGYFRIATTRGDFFSTFVPDEERESYSNVYVLDEGMKVVGRVEHLAPDESIYSARFMQGRVYLVTFKQIDPLFAIDLRDPRNPQVLGKLKVPGFSSYLHPYNDKLLIGVGKETETLSDERVVEKGLKLSLFDVSDVKNLQEIDTYKIGERGSESEVLFDHKAFLFSEEKHLLSLPVTLREAKSDDVYPEVSFRGAYVFTATEKGFELKGKIDHWDGRLDDDQREYFYGYNYYDNSVKRSLYIGDELYTFSNNYLQAHRLSDLSEVKRLNLKAGGDDYEINN